MEFVDKSNKKFKLTDERWKHITDTHPELKNLLKELSGTIEDPELIEKSVYDEEVVLLYRFYEHIHHGKYMCVVVKLSEELVITAYITDRIKRGEVVWKRN
ncbi:MAG: hypothetical protein C5S43_05185 [Candidatus Methanocomedens sp.]|nr:MAG: hypothetical protein C5S43_05185 [ANME-2 cluster archaeon]